MSIKTFRIFLTSCMVLAFPALATAQFKVSSDKPEVVKILEPDTGSDLANKSFRQKDWTEFELKFKIESKDKNKDFADRVVVQWRVAYEDPSRKGRFLLLEREVVHVNVPIGQDVYTSVYLSPNTIKKITGGENVSSSDYPQVGGVITVEGQQPVDTKKGFFSLKGSKVWWRELQSDNNIQLLKKSETPFQNLWYSRYAELEEDK